MSSNSFVMSGIEENARSLQQAELAQLQGQFQCTPDDQTARKLRLINQEVSFQSRSLKNDWIPEKACCCASVFAISGMSLIWWLASQGFEL